MLTDYHLHLRPDEDGHAAGALLHRARTSTATSRRPSAAGIEELGVSEHVYRFTPGARALATTRSGSEQASDDLDAYCEFVRATPLRLGIECDFVPGAEDRTATPARGPRLRLRRRLGPLRRRRRRRRPRAAATSGRSDGDPDEVWRRYFEALAEWPARASSTSSPTPTWSRSGASDRPLPERDPRHYYEPAVEAIAESGIAVEVSTAGLRKPVGELYPSPRVRRDVRRGRRRLRPLLRRPPARAGRLRLRPGARVPRRPRGRARSASSRAASGASSRSARAGRAGGGERQRVGIGYDSHRFAEGGRLILGGVEIEHERGLAGHSDADVLTHAVIDALLGAAGLGDIGTLFPDDEERWRDADSIDLLRTVVGTMPRADRQRRRHRDLRAAAARAPPGRDGAHPRRGDLGPGQRQGDDQRGHGLDRPRRGNRLHRGRSGRSATERALAQ